MCNLKLGCGVYDGSEIQEATSCLIHLSKANATVSVFAPNLSQHHVINHITGDVMAETRNILVSFIEYNKCPKRKYWID